MAASRRLRRKARGERPYFFDDPNVDKVVAMVMGLAGEVAVLHDRVDTIERLLQTRGLIKRAEIEGYAPSAEALAERAAWRETMLGEVLRILEIELEAAQTGDTAPYDAAIATVEDDLAARGEQRGTRTQKQNEKKQAKAKAKKKAKAT